MGIDMDRSNFCDCGAAEPLATYFAAVDGEVYEAVELLTNNVQTTSIIDAHSRRDAVRILEGEQPTHTAYIKDRNGDRRIITGACQCQVH